MREHFEHKTLWLDRAIFDYSDRLLGVLVICGASAGAQKPITDRNYRVYRGNGSPATLDDVIEAARHVNVTFIGEMHDDAVAHYLAPSARSNPTAFQAVSFEPPRPYENREDGGIQA